MSRMMILAGAGLTGCLVIGSATVALADGSPSPSATAYGKRAARLCQREPKVSARVNRLVARFSGDAGTRGSVLWLQARATKVRGRDAQLASIIDDRAKIRQSRIATLKLRQGELTKVVQWCAAHGHPVTS